MARKLHTNGYASAADLLAADDLPQYDLTLAGWKTSGGGEIKIRVRGLTLPERESVLLGAIRDGVQNEQALVEGYLRYGVVAPTLNASQAAQFAAKHAGTVAYVARFIQDLTNLRYDLIDAIAQSLNGHGADDPGGPGDQAAP